MTLQYELIIWRDSDDDTNLGERLEPYLDDDWILYGNPCVTTWDISGSVVTEYAQAITKERVTEVAGGEDIHYLITGEYGKEPMGCTWGEGGKEDVLEEESGATFEEVNKEDCPICKEN